MINFRLNPIESNYRQQNKCTSNGDFCFDRLENILGKGENADY